MKTNTIQLKAFNSPYRHCRATIRGLASLLFFLWLGTLQTNAQDWNAIIKRSAGNHENSSTSARSEEDNFGRSVAISGDIAIVGSYGENYDANGKDSLKYAGAAYILQRVEGNWTQIKMITAPYRERTDFFGVSVAISGDYAIVGADHEDENVNEQNSLSNSGSAYIYYRNQGGTDNWGLQKKITEPYRKEYNKFGLKVAISGNYAIVGVHYDKYDTNEQNEKYLAGSAYIFYRNQGGTDKWGMQQKITAPIREDGDNFGESVAISGDYVIVGAYGESEDSNEQNTKTMAGSAYIFYRNQDGSNKWKLQQKITAPYRRDFSYFGISVAISGEHIIVGASGEEKGAYIFYRNQGGADKWGIQKTISVYYRESTDSFAQSVDISGDYAIVGAPNEDEDANEKNYIKNAGSAYIYYRNQGGTNNWDFQKKITAPKRSIDDIFGLSVAISGDYAIIGALNENEDADELNEIENAGSVYFMERKGINIIREPVQYRSNAKSLSFSSASGWQSSPNGIDWSNATFPPYGNECTLAITIRNGHNATISSNIKLDQLTIENEGNITIDANKTLTITNDAGIDLDIQGTGSIVGAGNFTLLREATFRNSNTNGFNAINIKGIKTFGSSTNYEFNGTTLQTVNNPKGIFAQNFTINNAFGAKLSNDIVIKGTLATNLGDLDLNGHNVELYHQGGFLSENLALNHIVTDNTATDENNQGGSIILSAYVYNIGQNIKGTGLWLQRNDKFEKSIDIDIIRKHYKVDSKTFKRVYKISNYPSDSTENKNITMRIYYPAEETAGSTSGFRIFRMESAVAGWKNASNIAAGFTDGTNGAGYVEATNINMYSTWTVGPKNINLSTTLHYRSNERNVSFSSAVGWQSSNDNINWSNATLPPDGNQSKPVITIRNNNTASLNSNITLEQIKIESGGRITIDAGKTLTISNGTDIDLDIQGTGSITGNGNLTLLKGATFRTSHTNGFNAINVKGTKTFETGASYEFNGTTLQTINNPAGISANNFTINNALSATLSNNIRISGTLATKLGDLDLNGNNIYLDGIMSENLASNHIVTDYSATGEKNQGGSIIFSITISPFGSDIKGTGLWLLQYEGNNIILNVIRKHYKAGNNAIKRVYQIAGNSAGTNTTMRIYYPTEEIVSIQGTIGLFRLDTSKTGWKNAFDIDAGFTNGINGTNYVEAKDINDLSQLWTVGPKNANLSTITSLELSGKKSEGKVAIYPNPVKDVLTISLEGNTQKEIAVTLFDDQGKYYLQRNVALKAGKALLNLKNIQKSGLYFLRMQIGKDWVMEKVFIER
ncbi:MAG: T9SS type A sorting domain-containing protein [Pseudarcicella sp.]|nr:T9SS type A sorting domain-containing protein [Pseudarcicella sp.]MBP6409655.1 T9SS type A sorting domain-containing protein [Pseudarcicella sp.]